ncbi:MAG: ACT domain-containing protein, partial [Eubacteriales bacterium]|nr:ACT domain-containing protein [Eubacteriales bacterium]
TIVKEVGKVEKMLVRGVTRDNDVARISVKGLDDTPGKAFQVFSILAKHGVNVDVILQSAGSDNTNNISFTVAKANVKLAVEKIEENLERIGAQTVEADDSVSKVSIVGSGMSSNAGVAAKMFEALYDKNINIQMISTSEIKVSVIISEAEAERAVVAVHDKFDLGRQ